MSAEAYYEQVTNVLGRIRQTQTDRIKAAGDAVASSIQAGGFAFLYGSGHSVIPVMDVFPRYGSFVGFVPLYDPRLMWSNVVGPGGARELLWLERREGYAPVFLQSFPLRRGDCFIVFSHGGLNAAPIDAALYARERSLTVISVSSLANAAATRATHSSGKALPEVAHIAIDNCVAPEDSQVDVGRRAVDAIAPGQWSAHDGWIGRRGEGRDAWLATLSRLCGALRACGVAGPFAARLVLQESWTWLEGVLAESRHLRAPSQLDQSMRRLARPVLGWLQGASVAAAGQLRDRALAVLCAAGDDTLLPCLVQMLRAAPDTSSAGLDILGRHCTERLAARLALPPTCP
jgi:uncharacterized phosphosugar-binding protein